MKKSEKRRPYQKPEIKRHQSVAVVSGSDSYCDIYSSKKNGDLVYYH